MAARDNVVMLMDELQPRFQQLDATGDAAQYTFQLAQLLYSTAKSSQAGLRGNLDGSLEGRMMALAQALLAWAPQAAGAPAALLASSDGRPPLVLQFCAGCHSLVVLTTIASQLATQPSTAFRIAAACQLVFDAGRRITPAIAAEVEADAAAGRQIDAGRLGMLKSLAAQQLEAVSGCARLLLSDGQEQVAAAFARSTARPAVLVPWLQEVSRAVLALRGQHGGASAAGPDLPSKFSTCLGVLVVDASQLAPAIAADSAAQDALTSALLTSCLPYLAAKFSEAVAAGLPPSSHQHISALGFVFSAMQRLPLVAAVPRHMRAPGAAATLRAVASVVEAVAALPGDLPAGVAPNIAVANSTLLGMHLHAAQLLAACCIDLSRPAAAAAGSEPRNGGQQGDRGGGSGGSGGSSGEAMAADVDQQLEVAWALVAAVPHMCSAVRALVAAAAAGLGSVQMVSDVASLYGRLAHLLAEQTARGGALERLSGRMNMPSMLTLLLNGLCQALARLFQLDLASDGGAVPWTASEDLRAPCAAHVAAAAAYVGLAVAVARSASGGPVVVFSAGPVVDLMPGLCNTLALAVHVVPSLAGPAALAPVEDLLPSLLQAAPGAVADAVVALSRKVATNGRWAAALASSVLMAAGLDDAAGLFSSNEAGMAELASQTLEQVGTVLAALDAAAMTAVEGAAGSGVPDDLAAQLSEAASSLRQQRQAQLGGLPADAPPAQRAGWLRRLLQPAAELAALVQQYYALPAVDEPHRLALAQAAAGRCCAYLRCANVEGEGGPAAVEGAGSKCCSGCRTVWYCGKTCSKANWHEGGHRHVCAALEEARQAAKEARRAAREARRAAMGAAVVE
ncbi:hypothetical protein C2E21_1213 [Chlorella sorokiniana]|uniref:MYND-type domain-containing protein n=1 Tax=Chlorella sorokiniana TaxID=3076 RepID=A0A2P6U2J0_CHLSO|nr:hypothetical protein C2E21_1213 [Chlorella sorokiniana]|eukprot:PRW60531.1 hypothetical protein C2E21_1213 [Chlorella sorokiniana]